MAKPPESFPTSLTDYVKQIEDYQVGSAGPLWYRGCGRPSYELLPSLYRHPSHTALADLATLESHLMVRFRQRSVPFHSRDLSDDWNALFFMQHYRIPTRLLDWTENPFIGLYFAVMSAPYSVKRRGRLKFSESATIWVFDPVAWNRHGLRHQSFDGGVLVPGAQPLKGYKPPAEFSKMNTAPASLYGTHNSPRIVAQRGVFTIFGQSTTSMETTFENDGYPSGCLRRITLNSRVLPDLRRAILAYGITESVVFPDLEGLALEIRRFFEFES